MRSADSADKTCLLSERLLYGAQKRKSEALISTVPVVNTVSYNNNFVRLILVFRPKWNHSHVGNLFYVHFICFRHLA